MKALVLISGGIDSIVAAYIMRKLDLIFIHFNNMPYGDDRALKKSEELIKLLRKKAKLYVVDYGKVHKEFLKCNRRYHCILCKRMMYRIAEKIAKKEECRYLVTGENLGQVASQTLDNLRVIDNSISMIVLRPLLCYNKEEIINIAKKIGSFEISTLPGVCCSIVPKKPVTKAKLEGIKKEEKIDVNRIRDYAVKNAKLITIN